MRDFASQIPRWRPGLVAGPLLIGLCIGIPYGVSGMLVGAAYLPGLLLGLAVIMLPALYIGSALLGRAPAARQVLDTVLAALGDMGVVLAGLFPALAFLLATTARDVISQLLSLAVVALAALFGLRALFVRLEDGTSTGLRHRAFFGAWSLTALGIGFVFLVRMLTLLKGGLL